MDSQTEKPRPNAGRRARSDGGRGAARAEKARAEGAKAEVGGRNGPDPARYGDWEKDGIASDF